MNRAVHTSSTPVWQSDDLDALLALAGQKYSLAFEPVSAGGVSLQMLQIADMRERLDDMISRGALKEALSTLPLWAKIWPASLVLGHVLGALPSKEGSLLEIGAGCGLTGLVAAAAGFARVVISDIHEDALLFARINALKNNLGGTVEVRRMDITALQPEEHFDRIIASEILYLDDLYRPLVKFLGRHLARASKAVPTPEALLASDHRRDAKRFFKLAEKEFALARKDVGVRATDDGERPERHLITVHRLTRPAHAGTA